MDDEASRMSIEDKFQKTKYSFGELSAHHAAVCFDEDMRMDDDITELLIEFTEDQLSLLAAEGRFEIKGYPDDETLCFSKERTFDLRAAPTSDTLLVYSDWDENAGDELCQPVIVRRLCRRLFDICPSVSRLGRLRDLMDGHLLDENEPFKRGLTLPEILRHVQANSFDVNLWLREAGCIRIRNRYCIASSDFILSTLEKDVFEAPARDELTVAVRELCADRASTTDDHFRPDVDYVARIYGGFLLKSVKSMKLSEFLVSWKDAMSLLVSTEGHQSWTPQLKFLEGLALVFRKPTAPGKTAEYICYVNRLELPDGFKERLQSLFDFKKELSITEIKSYMQQLVVDDGDLERRLAPLTYSYKKGEDTFYLIR